MTPRRLPNGPRARVEAIRRSLGDAYEWDEREAALLDLAVRQAGDVEALERDVAEHGVRLESGKLNTAVCELRQGRVALARILGQIDIPAAVRPASVHARKAASARWAGWLMPRARGGWRYDRTVSAVLELIMGPTDGPGELTVEQLEVAWEVERESIMRDWTFVAARAGTRPWAFWWFELGEEMPRAADAITGLDAEAVRLAELGRLEPREIAVLHERAVEAGLRVGTDGERRGPDGRAVAKWKAVESRLRPREEPRPPG